MSLSALIELHYFPRIQITIFYPNETLAKLLKDVQFTLSGIIRVFKKWLHGGKHSAYDKSSLSFLAWHGIFIVAKGRLEGVMLDAQNDAMNNVKLRFLVFLAISEP